MSKEYPVYKQLDLPAIAEEMLARWDAEDTFRRSVDTREGCPPFVFYEGPPSANGMPGIHHVMARTIKDIFCRHRTLKATSSIQWSLFSISQCDRTILRKCAASVFRLEM